MSSPMHVFEGHSAAILFADVKGYSILIQRDEIGTYERLKRARAQFRQLVGDYGGVSAEASVALGVGANALVGGSNKSIVLQPISVQGQTGLNVALAVTSMTIRR